MSAPCNCGACRIRAALDLPLVSGAAIEQETAKRCLDSLAAVAAGLLLEAPRHWRAEFALVIENYIASGHPARRTH